MTSEQPGTPILDLTADGVEFAPWATIVENDKLHLGRVSFDVGSPLVTYVQEGLTYSLPPAAVPQLGELEATFVSIEVNESQADQKLGARLSHRVAIDAMAFD